MTDDPPAALLIAEVRKALDAGLAPGFAQKVAANALGIAQRELEHAPPASEPELTHLAEAIREGNRDEALIGDLIRLAVGKLRIDQPSYPPFRLWLEGDG